MFQTAFDEVPIYTRQKFSGVDFTEKKDFDYKRRFNQDIISHREFQKSAIMIRARQQHKSKGSDDNQIINSHFAWKDSQLRLKSKL